jgi:Tol biopolymer transport system component
MINSTLDTMITLQQDPAQNYGHFFYPYYRVIDPTSGNDLAVPYHDTNVEIPSGDNALLYSSLLITEGWAKSIGDSVLEGKARLIREGMNFRMFLLSQGDKLFIAHTKNAETGDLSDSRWDVYADEGGVVIWIAYLSGSVTFDEYKRLTESQKRQAASWSSCTSQSYMVQEAAFFNAMFAWSVRSLAGFPIGDYDSPGGSRSLYAPESLIPNAQAHLAYGDCLGFEYPAFSDAMTQSDGNRGLVGWIQGWYIPPNIPGLVGNTPHHAMPHALFVPFNAGTDLGSSLKSCLIQKITELKDDQAGYYHDTGPYPFGFEVVVSPYRDDVSYSGADEGRNIFETLSQAYTVLSLFNALQLNDEKPAFYTIAAFVSGYSDKVREVLNYLYPSSLTIRDVDPDWSPAGDRIAFVSDRDGSWEIYITDRSSSGAFDFSNATRMTYNNADDLSPAWSPTGERIAFVSNRDESYRVYVMNSDGSGQTPVTGDVCTCKTCWPTSTQPTWAPDGKWLAFATQEDVDYCRYSSYRVHPDGTELQRLSSDPWGASNDIEPDWSPLGDKITYSTNRTGKYRLAWMNAESGQGPGDGQGITDEPPCSSSYASRYGQPAWSPDGAYIAFGDMCLGKVHVIAATGSEETILANGFNPDWAPDGKMLVYDTGNAIRFVTFPTRAVFRVTEGGNVLADQAYYGAGFLSGFADVAEWVPVSEPVEPGDVLELDPCNPGYYCKSRGPCSALVAGVVSTEPGFVLGTNPSTLDFGPWTDDSRPWTSDSALLALIGIVPVKVTDEGGPIQPGDLLVTSSTPGYAMRWSNPDPCLCSLVGKALEPMIEEQGVIFVLLTAH